MLAAAGRGLPDLECGVQMPMSSVAERIVLRADHLPSPLHNNCSGKHAGFICTACHLGIDPRGYVQPDHPVQHAVTAALADLTGTQLGATNRGIDGCSIPAYAIPLDRLAGAFARMTTGEGLAPGRAAAARRILDACMTEPFMVAGSGRFDTDVMPLFPGRLFVKGGAEGVYCGALPEAGLGIALKIDDGASRASETAMAAVIASRLTASDDAADTAFARWRAAPVRNRRGITVGEVRPTAELLDALGRGP
jgi:L-asparaginase II